jgi:homoserine kinase
MDDRERAQRGASGIRMDDRERAKRGASGIRMDDRERAKRAASETRMDDRERGASQIRQPVRVRAPATTANLGPGFDCLGAALSISLDIDTEAPDELPRIVRRAIREGARAETADAKGAIVSDIPRARGLGSSAACVAAGLLLGAAQAGREVDRAELLRVGTPIEGHPDNLAAALFGGITLALPNRSVMRYEPSGGVRPMILVPGSTLATKEARKALPDHVARDDAIANVARAGGLLTMLTGAATPARETLLECTEDRIHQPYRAELMPETFEVIGTLRERGIAAAVSGAGPSVVCLVLRGAEQEVREAAASMDGWTLLECDWDLEGARIMES